MVNVSDLTYTSLETISGFDLQTGANLFVLDELQNATLAQTEEKQEITGKGGRKLTALKRNKGVTISGANGLVSGGLLAIQTGGEFTNGATNVKWTDYLEVNSDEATTSYTAVGTTGNEIEYVYVKNSDGTIAQQLTQDSAAGAGKFAYDPATKKLTFASGAIADGTEIVVFYTRKITASTLDNMSDKYSGKCELYVDAMAEDTCGNVYRVQFYIPKADFSGEFDIELGDDQTVHNFEAESMISSCVKGSKKGLLWTYTVFGSDAEDVS